MTPVKFMLKITVPFSETTEVRLNSLQLCASLEQLLCHAHSLLTSCHMMNHMTGGGRGPGLTGETCQQLLNSLTHQTALYCSRLFTVRSVTTRGMQRIVGERSRAVESICAYLESRRTVQCLTEPSHTRKLR